MDPKQLPSYLFDPASFKNRFDAQAWGLPHQETVASIYAGIEHGAINWWNALQPRDIWLWALLTGIFAVIIYVWAKPTKGKVMGTRDSEAKLVADAITDAIEDLRYRDLLTRKSKRYWYKRLAKACQLNDLVKVHPERVKHEIKKRRANGVNKPANIPGDPPTVVVAKVKPVVKRRGISAAIASSKATAAA